MIIDDVRARYPALSGALYFYEPSQPVTLEMIDTQGKSFSFTAPTVAEVIAQAFPELTAPEPRVTCPKCGHQSGDDWRQCNGSCPMPASPHYQSEPTEPEPETPAASVFD